MRFQDKLIRALEVFKKNPFLFLKYLRYRFKRLGIQWNKYYRGTYDVTLNGVKYQVDFDRLGSNIYTKQILFKCYELHVIEAMKKYIKPGSTFIDVGANVGYLTAVGASLVGETGAVISFEPVPTIYDFLKKTASINPNYKIKTYNKAISDDNLPIMIHATSIYESGLSSALSGFLKLNNEKIETSITVDSIRLDEFIIGNNINNISVIKIDIEGYEFSALKSLEGYFESNQRKPIIICELAPDAYHLLGFTISDIFSYMKKFGYKVCDSYDLSTLLTSDQIKKTKDVVFIPLDENDLEFSGCKRW